MPISLRKKLQTIPKRDPSKQLAKREMLPWIEKYRPNDLAEVIGHDSKINALRNLIKNRNLPNLLFNGLPGTGKTSLALAIVKTMHGANYKRYMLELNASDDRGIDTVRNKIPMFAKTKSDDLRIIILDEADAMTIDAQFALRRIIELYSPNCRFFLICNNVNKIIPGLQSRCTKMRFGVLDQGSIRTKLEMIIAKEQIDVEPEAITQLLELHHDFRQILNTLQCLKGIRFGEKIRLEDVSEYLGMADSRLVNALIKLLDNESFKTCYAQLLDLHRENKVSISDLIKKLVDHLILNETITETKRSYLLDGLAKVEYRMITGSDTEIQLASLVGVWLGSREIA